MDLALVERFLNTLDERSFTRNGRQHVPSDTLTSADALAAWFGEQGLADDVRPESLVAAITLRDALRQALTEDADQAGIGGALADFPVRLTPGTSGELRITASSGVPGLDTIVETVTEAVAGAGWGRMKLCSAPDCRWAFYDTSRNGGGRWCRMEACGNRSKTRAYRRRRTD